MVLNEVTPAKQGSRRTISLILQASYRFQKVKAVPDIVRRVWKRETLCAEFKGIAARLACQDMAASMHPIADTVRNQ